MTSIILALLLLSGIAAAPSLPPSTSCALRGGADRAEPWTPEEDQKLLELQGKLGKKWKEISNQMGNRRSSKGCSARFARISANRASSAADQSKGREEQADGEAVKVEATEDRNVEAPKARLTKKQRTKPGGDEGRMREERTADASKHDDDEQQKVSTAKRALPDGVAQTDQEDFDVKADEANKKKRRKAAAEYEPATTQVVDHTTAPDLELFESKIEQVHEGDEGEREVTTDKASRDEIEKSAAEQGKIQDAWADLDAMREETRLRRQKIQSMWDRKTHAGKRTGFHVKLPVKKQSFGLQDGKKVKLRLYPLPGAINQRKAREQNLSEEEELEQEAIENRTSTEQEVAIQNQTFTDHKGRRWVFQSEVGDELHFVRARKSKKTKESKKAESLKTEECKKAESDLRSLFDLQPLPEGWDKLKPKEKRQVLREQANAFLSACE
ncbi:hypothetical protein GUITHDRAFT_163360 [Guillardia theta CCMP2712]|uniref:Uncharacterized protein n=1 Tax=Guillardia theta (strain CCMP2712) TaxID=905079 RepID=L1JB16_GUITC|nr:hypothetical protein GUITHDRAFT_163360 [Guillardia theta CCMP2712]EKX45284.1 hypothetical protein GUITHDRAFT_163360 [Guillardia theta CCMP2712]|eukprot:XP_005832264.1 hypothetical protein GUITHDRAFT_163360 [Guillardia theta CCMP2712]